MKKAQSHSEVCRQILDEAAAWFVEFRDGGADALTHQNFNAWLRRSPDHIRAYLEIAGVWADLPAAQSQAAVDAGALIASAQGSANVIPLDSAAARKPRKPARSLVPSRLAAAACVTIACAAAFFIWSKRDLSYSTGIGEQRFVTLSDGSTVMLNALSTIDVRFTEAERNIELLAGQALFDVSEDRSRPFVVASGGTRVKAVGTQFDVYRKKSATVVTVVEGRVAISAPLSAQEGAATDSSSLISAGQQVTVTPNAMRRPAPVDVNAATAWTQRRLVFNSTRLADVAEEFNRYNPRSLIVQNELLAQIQISGIYSSTDPTSLLGFLRLQPGVEVIETEHEIKVNLR